MKKKILTETNPYLKDPKLRKKKLIAEAVRTSCAVEGIEVEMDETRLKNITQSKEKRIFKAGGMLSGRATK